MTVSDLERLSEIFDDSKHPGISATAELFVFVVQQLKLAFIVTRTFSSLLILIYQCISFDIITAGALIPPKFIRLVKISDTKRVDI